MQDRELVKQIDALRPGSDDLQRLGDESLRERLEHDAEARQLCDRIQDLDLQLRAAIRQVETPDGLDKRLLAELASAADRHLADDVTSGFDSAGSQLAPEDRFAPSASPPRSLRSQRRWLWKVFGTGMAASVALALFLSWPTDRGIQNVEYLLSESMRFYREEDRQPVQPLTADRSLNQHPISVHVRRTFPPQWRPLRGFMGRSGVAYELRGPGGAKATLYVLRAKVPGMPLFPRSESRQTGGLWVSAWSEGPLAYVLVIPNELGRNNSPDLFLKPLSPQV